QSQEGRDCRPGGRVPQARIRERSQEMNVVDYELSIFTTPLADYTYQRKLVPPGSFYLYSPLMVLVPRPAFKDSLWEKVFDLLPEEDWFRDGGQLCLILGEARMKPDGRYYPEESYPLEECIRLTKEFRAPQKKHEQKEQENAEKRRQRDIYQQQRADQQREAAEQRRVEMEQK